MAKSRVLVTGAQGYLGSVLLAQLDRRGYRTVGVDNGLVSEVRVPLAHGRYVTGDVRDPSSWEAELEHVDAVVHLAANVGDPACGLSSALTWETNYLGTVAVAAACRRYGVRRFVFASTCSNYGSTDGFATVRSPLFPQSEYAKSKIYAEHHLLACSDRNFTARILRLSTLYGLSPRMRLDLVINRMTAMAVTEGRIEVYGGNQWRPFLHVRDAARAIISAVDLPPADPCHVWNCGVKSGNYQIIDIAKIIAEEVPATEVVVHPSVMDQRDYIVDFAHDHGCLTFDSTGTLVGDVRAMIRDLPGTLSAAPPERMVNHDIVRARQLADDPRVAPAHRPAWPL